MGICYTCNKSSSIEAANGATKKSIKQNGKQATTEQKQFQTEKNTSGLVTTNQNNNVIVIQGAKNPGLEKTDISYLAKPNGITCKKNYFN